MLPLGISLKTNLKLGFDLIEEKIDGYFFKWNENNLTSKRKICRNDHFPHLVNLLKKHFQTETFMVKWQLKMKPYMIFQDRKVEKKLVSFRFSSASIVTLF